MLFIDTVYYARGRCPAAALCLPVTHIDTYQSVDGCRQRHREKHAGDSADAASNRYRREHPDPGKPERGPDDPGVDQISFQLLQHANEHQEDQCFHRADCQAHQCADCRSEIASEYRDQCREAYHGSNHRRVRKAKCPHADRAQHAYDDGFNHLADIRKLGLQHLTKQILSHRALFESSFYETYNEVTNEVYDLIDGSQVEDRLWRNWVMLLAAYKTLYQQLSLPFDYEEMKKLCVEGIKRQNSEIISNNELGNLWNAMTYLFEEGMIFADGDFKVKYVKSLKTDKADREYKTHHPILMLRLNHFIGQYKRMARQQGDSVMSKTCHSSLSRGDATYIWRI